jgi:raffinose/stachyose/melibiose transport system substrate-binding protein
MWYLSASPQEMDVITARTKQYQETHPGVTIELSFYNFDDYLKTTKLAMDSGAGPDIFYGDGNSLGIGLAKAGLVVDLTDAIKKYGWDKRFGSPLPWSWYWDTLTPGGHYYGIPYDFTTVGVYYNEAIFSELGLERPKTFADFQNILATIKEKKPDIAPISVGASDGWPLSHVYDQLVHTTVPYTELEKFAVFPAAGGDWNQPGAVEAATILQDWATKGYFQENYLATGDSDALNLFMTGKSALFIAGTWNSGAIGTVTAFPVRFFAMPPVHTDINPDGSWHMGGFSINNPWYLNKASKYPDQALDLLDFMLNKDTALALWTGIADTVAYTFPESEAPAPVHPFQKDIYDAMHTAKNGFYLDMPVYGTQQLGNLQSLAAGKMTPQKFVEEATKLYARALSEQK